MLSSKVVAVGLVPARTTILHVPGLVPASAVNFTAPAPGAVPGSAIFETMTSPPPVRMVWPSFQEFPLKIPRCQSIPFATVKMLPKLPCALIKVPPVDTGNSPPARPNDRPTLNPIVDEGGYWLLRENAISSRLACVPYVEPITSTICSPILSVITAPDCSQVSTSSPTFCPAVTLAPTLDTGFDPKHELVPAASVAFKLHLDVMPT